MSRVLVTPPVLQRFGIPAEAGKATLRAANLIYAIEGQQLYRFTKAGKHPLNPARAGERVHPDKKVEIKMYLARLAAEMIHQAGRRRTETMSAASLDQIAARMGWKSTWTVYRNSLRARLTRQVSKRVGGANRAELAIPEGVANRPHSVGAENYWNPTLKQLRAANLPVKFREDLDDMSGYCHLQPLIFHPLLPIGASSRIVMAHLQSRGFMQPVYCSEHKQAAAGCRTCYRQSQGEFDGQSIQISPAAVGKAVSMRRETVTAALKGWKALGVIDYFTPPAKPLEGNKAGWEQECMIICWLPQVRLTHELRAVEQKRILAMANAMRKHTWWEQNGEDLKRAIFARLWSATANEWRMEAYRIDLRRFLTGENVPGEVIATLLPRPPDTS